MGAEVVIVKELVVIFSGHPNSSMAIKARSYPSK